MAFDFFTLNTLRTHHPAWRLLRSDHAPLVTSFLHRTFVTPNVRVVAAADLAETLEDELFDLALPADVIRVEQKGVSQFANRYGFLDKPHRIRLRVLDERIQLLPGAVCPDLTLGVASFARLKIPLQRVFITENETNFLAFPNAHGAIVIFGAGYGWDTLAEARWLADC